MIINSRTRKLSSKIKIGQLFSSKRTHELRMALIIPEFAVSFVRPREQELERRQPICKRFSHWREINVKTKNLAAISFWV